MFSHIPCRLRVNLHSQLHHKFLEPLVLQAVQCLVLHDLHVDGLHQVYNILPAKQLSHAVILAHAPDVRALDPFELLLQFTEQLLLLCLVRRVRVLRKQIPQALLILFQTDCQAVVLALLLFVDVHQLDVVNLMVVADFLLALPFLVDSEFVPFLDFLLRFFLQKLIAFLPA